MDCSLLVTLQGAVDQACQQDARSDRIVTAAPTPPRRTLLAHSSPSGLRTGRAELEGALRIQRAEALTVTDDLTQPIQLALPRVAARTTPKLNAATMTALLAGIEPGAHGTNSAGR